MVWILSRDLEHVGGTLVTQPLVEPVVRNIHKRDIMFDFRVIGLHLKF